MRYRNKKTGALIESSGTLSGGDWQLEAAMEDVIEPDGKDANEGANEGANETSSEETPANKKKESAKK